MRTLIPLTVVVLASNEERNLPACLASVTAWAADIVVVDSGSTDNTLGIARQYGARVAQHPFETHARQWRWALQHLPIATAWVLGLDADQRLTPALRDEIGRQLTTPGAETDNIAGYYMKRRQIFRGTWIKRGGYYPKYLLKLFRRDTVWVPEDEEVDHHFRVRGNVAKLHHDLIEENRYEEDIAIWIAKHTRYATLQAQEELHRLGSQHTCSFKRAFLGSPDDRVQWCKQLWQRLPLYVRPVLFFVYRYVCRLGFLDGKAGFTFHVLQTFWYRLLVDIQLDTLRQQ
jgi:glycosyltransferase involved in cell wall biosynthesis